MSESGDDWSDFEIDATVADYFSMLVHDLNGVKYNKAAHNRALHQIIGRSRGAIEFKHQNISAVLLGLGQPWIIGYKPASNFQNALIVGVLRFLDQATDWNPIENKKYLPKQFDQKLRENQGLWIGPPPAQHNESPPIQPETLDRVVELGDPAARDARNRILGDAGEKCVLEHEVATLRNVGRIDLAERVKWTAQENMAAGYDILSFYPDGRERWIEVKTTSGWERTPFHISRNECLVAEQNSEKWTLMRLYHFSRQPKAFELRPPLSNHVALTPTGYLAHLR